MRPAIHRTFLVLCVALIVPAAFSWGGCMQRGAQGAAFSSSGGMDSGLATAAQEPGCIDVNSASAEELMKLPGIGKVTAARIIEFRQRHGPFRRAQEIIIIHGLSERKYRKLAPFVCAR